jgi:hypothetical protein
MESAAVRLRWRDPVLTEQIRQEERNLLLGFLRRYLKRSFTAADLSKHTGIGKSRVRQLLETSLKVSVIGRGGRYVFQSRAPKQKHYRQRPFGKTDWQREIARVFGLQVSRPCNNYGVRSLLLILLKNPHLDL